MVNAKTTWLLLLLAAGGCRGGTATEPPIHWQRQMFTQDKGKPQRENDFFADHRAMRPQVEGTVSTTAAIDNDRFYKGMEGGQFIAQFPVAMSWDLLRRGQERYNIYCAPCHDRTGSGNGLIFKRAKQAPGSSMIQPSSYHDDRLRNMPVGEIFNTITHGIRTMPSYAYQVPVEDRWAIVAYIRALQRSQQTTLSDVPPEMRSNLR